MDPLTAFLDSNVLYPAALRNLLMWLTLRGLFRARWTDVVHEEWMAAVRRDFTDVTRQQLERQGLIQTAAALRGHASVL